MKTKRKIDYVYVLDIDGNPLMPTKRFRKVRLMLKNGHAKVVRRDVFTIQLLYKPKTHYVQALTLGCDTGYEHIGLSVSNYNAEYYAEETIIDNGTVKRLETRAFYRRSRRNRKTRYRQSKFNNRTSSKKKGWLSPSVKHRRDAHLNRINFICSILPIKNVIVEPTSFDVQKIKNPDIQGVEYQQGETLDFENKRQYVLCRDRFKCQHCGSKEHLEVHHIIYRSQGGTDDVNNLITLCHECHQGVHKGNVKISRSKVKSFKAAAGVSSMKKSLIDILNEIYTEVYVTYGYITKANRNKYNLSKTHCHDAFAIAGNLNAKHLDYHYKCIQKKRHERSIHVHNYIKGGIRRSNIAFKYLKNSQFKKDDFVLYNGMRCFITGSTNGYAVLKDINGSKQVKSAVTIKKLNFVRRPVGQFLTDIVYDK